MAGAVTAGATSFAKGWAALGIGLVVIGGVAWAADKQQNLGQTGGQGLGVAVGSVGSIAGGITEGLDATKLGTPTAPPPATTVLP